MIAYHGTSLADAVKIMRQGFDLSLAGSRQRALRGEEVAEVKGVYLTHEHLARHFYATSDLKQPGRMDGAVIKANVSGKLMPAKEWWTLRRSIDDDMGLHFHDPRRAEAIKLAVKQVESRGYVGLWENDEEFVVLDPKNVKPLSAYRAHDKKPLSVYEAIAAVLDGASPGQAIQERIDPKWLERVKTLQPNDKLLVYHGTGKVYLPYMINGFDAATQEMSRHYGGPKHAGLFVTLDPTVADNFSSYGDVILELEVRAKNLHGTDYSGNIWGKKEDALWVFKYPDSFRPGLSYSITSAGSEPQALLLGMVSPQQIKRIRWREEGAPRNSGTWYTRDQILKKNVVIKGQPGSGYGEFPLEGWDIDLSSTKTTVDQFLKAVAKHVGKDVEHVVRAWAKRGEEDVYDKLRYTLHFGNAAARALAKKLVQHFTESLISRVLKGEDPFLVVNELTTTAHSLGQKIPRPMGLVKRTRRKDQGEEPVYESLLERAAQWLLERKRAPMMTMYHGTSTKFLREILKQGLVPNPRMRVWKEDPSAKASGSQQSRKALDGVYFTANFMTAVSAGGNAHRKFGGTYLFVAAQIQPRSAYADEDDLHSSVQWALRDMVGYTENYSQLWGAMQVSDTAKGQKVKEFEEALKKQLDRLLKERGLSGEKIRIDTQAAEDILVGFVEQNVYANTANDKENYQAFIGYCNQYEKEKGVVLTGGMIGDNIRWQLQRARPDYAKAESRYLKGLEKLTRQYKGIAMPGQDSFDWFTHTLRMPDRIDFNGRNKILAVFQSYHDVSVKPDVSYIIVHHGTITPRMLADMKRSNWLSGDEVKIITPAEAKKLGINLGE